MGNRYSPLMGYSRGFVAVGQAPTDGVALQSLSDFSAVSVCHTSPVIYAAA